MDKSEKEVFTEEDKALALRKAENLLEAMQTPDKDMEEALDHGLDLSISLIRSILEEAYKYPDVKKMIEHICTCDEEWEDEEDSYAPERLINGCLNTASVRAMQGGNRIVVLREMLKEDIENWG